jgi:hypothetical protein
VQFGSLSVSSKVEGKQYSARTVVWRRGNLLTYSPVIHVEVVVHIDAQQ